MPQAVRLADSAVLRLVAGLAGGALVLYGLLALLQGDSRGAAATMVLGFVAGHWGLKGYLLWCFGPRR